MQNTYSSFLMSMLVLLGSHLLAQEVEEKFAFFDDDTEYINKPNSYTLEQCIDASEAVFEGIVKEATVFKDESGKSYTAFTVKVTKTFKGRVDKITTIIYEDSYVELFPNYYTERNIRGYRADNCGIFFTRNANVSGIEVKNLQKLLKLRDSFISIYYQATVKEMEKCIQLNNYSVADNLQHRFYDRIEQHVGRKYKKYRKLLSIKPKKAFHSEKISK